MTVIVELLSAAFLAKDMVKCYDAMGVEDWKPYRFPGGLTNKATYFHRSHYELFKRSNECLLCNNKRYFQ